MSYIQRHVTEFSADQANGPSDPRTEILLELDEAAAYIGVTTPILGALLKQYGVGRYHLNRSHDQIAYSLGDLARMKEAMTHNRPIETMKTALSPEESTDTAGKAEERTRHRER